MSWKQFIGENLWGSPAIFEDQVIISGHGIRSLDLHTGEHFWKDEQFKAGSGSATPAIAGESIYCPGLNHLAQREMGTGKLIVQIEPGSMYSSPLVAFDRVFWPGSGQGKRALYAAEVNSENIAWKHPFGAAIHFSSSANDDFIFCASVDELHAIEPDSGATVWIWKTDGSKPIGTALIIDDRVVLGLEKDGLVCLEAKSGDLVWELNLPHGIAAPPAYNPTRGLIFAAGDRLNAIEAEIGEIQWASEEYNFKNSAPIVLGQNIFIGGGFDRAFYLFSADDGQLVWQHASGDLVYSTAAYSQGHVVIGSHDGYLYCFEIMK